MAVTSKTETERKYDVKEGLQVPDLSSVGEVQSRQTVTLKAVYYDTADGALSARLITLRRRSGGADEGWHIKTPAGSGRTENHAPLADEAPTELLDLVRPFLRNRPLIEIARLTTQRTVIWVANKDGDPVVEVADDLVSATDVGTGILRIWREWESELLDKAPTAPKKREALLDRVEKVLAKAGAHPSRSASKLARSLGRDSLANAPGRHAALPPAVVSLSRDSTSLQVAMTIIGDLVERLMAADTGARRDEPDGVHQMRTVVRRLRAVLAAFRPVLDAGVTDDIRDRLRQFGSVLGAVRDTEVRAAHALALLGELEAPDADIHRRLVEDAEGEHGIRLVELVEYLGSGEYFSLLDDLEGLLERPPVTEASMNPAGAELKAALKEQARRARKRAKRVSLDDLDALHAARKAARRVRYIAEALTSGPGAILGKKATALADAAEAVHDAAGDHRDAALFQELVSLARTEATEAGETTGGYAALSRLEDRNARTALDRLAKASANFRALTKTFR